MASTIAAGTTSGTAIAIAGDTSGVLQLQTNGTTAAVTINTSQNVGIGTTSPTGKLDVSSSSAGVTAGDLVVDTANSVVYVGRQSSTGGDNSFLLVRGRLNGSGTNQAIAITGDTTAYGTGLFRPNNDTLGFSTLATERMRIASDGAISAGSTTSTVGLGVFSNFGSRILDFARYADDGATVGFKRGGTVVGSISVNASATAYNTSSDYRLKENIAPMAGALATVSTLKPVTYKWKVDGSDGQGFIAHELAEVMPQAVTGIKDAIETFKDEDGVEQTRPSYQGIDTSFLVATLTAAIQELNAKVDAQAVRIAELEGAK